MLPRRVPQKSDGMALYIAKSRNNIGGGGAPKAPMPIGIEKEILVCSACGMEGCGGFS